MFGTHQAHLHRILAKQKVEAGDRGHLSHVDKEQIQEETFQFHLELSLLRTCRTQESITQSHGYRTCQQQLVDLEKVGLAARVRQLVKTVSSSNQCTLMDWAQTQT